MKRRLLGLIAAAVVVIVSSDAAQAATPFALSISPYGVGVAVGNYAPSGAFISARPYYGYGGYGAPVYGAPRFYGYPSPTYNGGGFRYAPPSFPAPTYGGGWYQSPPGLPSPTARKW